MRVACVGLPSCAVVLGYGVMLVWDVLLLHRYFPQSREHPWLFLQWVDQFLPLALTGLLTTIGLSSKNAILIVEFANQKQEAGEDKMSAIKDAALQRLRPILMTSASTVLGLIPLAFATGEGCNQRIAMGTAVVGGMVVSTLLTMYIVPAIYSYISTNRIKKLQE